MRNKWISRISFHIVAIIIAIILIYPIFMIAELSIKTADQAFTLPPLYWGFEPDFSPYTQAFGGEAKVVGGSYTKMGQFLSNSLIITIGNTILVMLLSIPAAYAFAKYDFKYKGVLFPFILITIMLPRFLWLIPTLQMMVWLKVTNTWFPMVVPQIANAFGVFLMTQFIEGSVPVDLIDAARIDGLSEFQILLQVGFPLSRWRHPSFWEHVSAASVGRLPKISPEHDRTHLR